MSSTFVQTMQAMRSPSEAVRDQAMQTLGLSGDLRSAGFLELAMSCETNSKVIFSGEQALRNLKKRVRISTPIGALVDVQGRSTFTLDGLEAFLCKEPLPPRGELLRLLLTLSTLRSPRLIKSLGSLLKRSNDEEVLRSALITLGTTCGGKALSLLVSMLTHDNPILRCAACDGLFLTGELVAYAYFVGTLSDTAMPVRRRSLLYLRWLGRENLLNLMRSMASSSKPWKREAVARGIGLFRGSVYAPLLEALLKDSAKRVQKAAMLSLIAHAKRGVQEARVILAKHHQKSSNDASLPCEQVAETLIGAPMEETALPWPDLDAPDVAIRMEVIDEIARSRDEAGIVRFTELVKVEKDKRVLSFLLSAMGRIADGRFQKILEAHLQHKLPRVRANAVEALACFLPPMQRGILVDLLADVSNRVRATAVVALRETDGVDIINPLQEMLQSEDPAWVHSGVFAVSVLGTEEAVLLLEPILSFKDEKVRDRIHTLLETFAEAGMECAESMLLKVDQGPTSREVVVDYSRFESGVSSSHAHPSQSVKIDWEANLNQMSQSEVEALLAGHERSKIYRDGADEISPTEAANRIPSLVAEEDDFEDIPSSTDVLKVGQDGPSTHIVAPKTASLEKSRRATKPVDISSLSGDAAVDVITGKHCLHCGEMDKVDALKCRFCGEAFDTSHSKKPPSEILENPITPGPTHKVNRESIDTSRRPANLLDRRERRIPGENQRPTVAVILLLLDIIVGALAVVAGLWMCMNREIPLSEAFLTILYGGACFFVGVQLFFGSAWARWVQVLLFIPLAARALVLVVFAIFAAILSFLPSTVDWCRR